VAVDQLLWCKAKCGLGGLGDASSPWGTRRSIYVGLWRYPACCSSLLRARRSRDTLSGWASADVVESQLGILCKHYAKLQHCCAVSQEERFVIFRFQKTIITIQNKSINQPIKNVS